MRTTFDKDRESASIQVVCIRLNIQIVTSKKEGGLAKGNRIAGPDWWTFGLDQMTHFFLCKRTFSRPLLCPKLLHLCAPIHHYVPVGPKIMEDNQETEHTTLYALR